MSWWNGDTVKVRGGADYWTTAPDPAQREHEEVSDAHIRARLQVAEDIVERQRSSFDTPLTIPLLAFIAVLLPLIVSFIVDSNRASEIDQMSITESVMNWLRVSYIFLMSFIAIGVARHAQLRQRRGAAALRWVRYLNSELETRAEERRVAERKVSALTPAVAPSISAHLRAAGSLAAHAPAFRALSRSK